MALSPAAVMERPRGQANIHTALGLAVTREIWTTRKNQERLAGAADDFSSLDWRALLGRQILGRRPLATSGRLSGESPGPASAV